MSTPNKSVDRKRHPSEECALRPLNADQTPNDVTNWNEINGVASDSEDSGSPSLTNCDASNLPRSSIQSTHNQDEGFLSQDDDVIQQKYLLSCEERRYRNDQGHTEASNPVNISTESERVTAKLDRKKHPDSESNNSPPQQASIETRLTHLSSGRQPINIPKSERLNSRHIEIRMAASSGLIRRRSDRRSSHENLDGQKSLRHHRDHNPRDDFKWPHDKFKEHDEGNYRRRTDQKEAPSKPLARREMFDNQPFGPVRGDSNAKGFDRNRDNIFRSNDQPMRGVHARRGAEHYATRLSNRFTGNSEGRYRENRREGYSTTPPNDQRRRNEHGSFGGSMRGSPRGRSWGDSFHGGSQGNNRGNRMGFNRNRYRETFGQRFDRINYDDNEYQGQELNSRGRDRHDKYSDVGNAKSSDFEHRYPDSRNVNRISLRGYRNMSPHHRDRNYFSDYSDDGFDRRASNYRPSPRREHPDVVGYRESPIPFVPSRQGRLNARQRNSMSDRNFVEGSTSQMRNNVRYSAQTKNINFKSNRRPPPTSTIRAPRFNKQRGARNTGGETRVTGAAVCENSTEGRRFRESHSQESKTDTLPKENEGMHVQSADEARYRQMIASTSKLVIGTETNLPPSLQQALNKGTPVTSGENRVFSPFRSKSQHGAICHAQSGGHQVVAAPAMGVMNLPGVGYPSVNALQPLYYITPQGLATAGLAANQVAFDSSNQLLLGAPFQMSALQQQQLAALGSGIAAMQVVAPGSQQANAAWLAQPQLMYPSSFVGAQGDRNQSILPNYQQQLFQQQLLQQQQQQLQANLTNPQVQNSQAPYLNSEQLCYSRDANLGNGDYFTELNNASATSEQQHQQQMMMMSTEQLSRAYLNSALAQQQLANETQLMQLQQNNPLLYVPDVTGCYQGPPNSVQTSAAQHAGRIPLVHNHRPTIRHAASNVGLHQQGNCSQPAFTPLYHQSPVQISQVATDLRSIQCFDSGVPTLQTSTHEPGQDVSVSQSQINPENLQ